MNRKGKLFRALGAGSLVAGSVLTIASTSGAANSSIAKGQPVKIGISLSLSGDFWAADVNKSGGLLGHKVVLDIVSDASSPTQVITNYQKLISVDHVNLTFGPFSSLLTLPAAKAVSRYGYAMVEGAGGAPSVFSAGLKNVFDVTLPVANALQPFAKWISSLPASQRPKTAAYVTSNDPFTQPQLPVAQKILEKAGIKTVYNNVFPAEVTDFTPIADKVAAAKPQVVILGAVDVPTVSSFMQAFEQSGFNPKVFIATAGPDQGTAFTKMVAEYNKLYGGTPAGVNADVAEAYSVGQTIAAAVKATGGFDNSKIIKYLHSGKVIATVQGNASFNAQGQNFSMTAYTFQWQGAKFVQVMPTSDPNSVKVLLPKPVWGK